LALGSLVRRRYKLKVEYTGTRYSGWMAHTNSTKISVEEAIKVLFSLVPLCGDGDDDDDEADDEDW